MREYGIIKIKTVSQHKNVFSIFALLLILSISISFISCGQPEIKEDYVKKAYELRLDGKVDEAEALLIDIIAKDSTNAAAHYELARTYYHMSLGMGDAILEYLQKSEESINLAIKHDYDNVIYNFFACRVGYLEAYIAMSGDEDIARRKLNKLRKLYETVLEIEPEYHEATLYLIEAYGIVPENLGKDYTAAENLGMEIDGKDRIWGAKALTVLRSKAIDVEKLWKMKLDDFPDNPDALEELGKFYLRENKTEEGLKYLNQAMERDSTKTYIYLDIARQYTINALMDKSKLEENTLLVEEVINKYLETNPIAPLKAFAFGFLGNLKLKSDDDDGLLLLGQATMLDKYYSRFSVMPSMDLFVPPDEISHNHRYLFRPM